MSIFSPCNWPRRNGAKSMWMMTFCIRSLSPLANFLFLVSSFIFCWEDCQSCWITAAAIFGIYESPEFGHEILYEIISANIVAKYSEGHLSLTSKTIIDITTYWPGFQVVIYVISVQHPAWTFLLVPWPWDHDCASRTNNQRNCCSSKPEYFWSPVDNARTLGDPKMTSPCCNARRNMTICSRLDVLHAFIGCNFSWFCHVNV